MHAAMIEETFHEPLMRASEAVAAYCKNLGLEDARLDERQRLDLKIDGLPTSICFLAEKAPALWIGCEIGDIRADDREAMIWLLQANAGPWFVAGQRIALLPGTTTAVIYTIAPVNELSAEMLPPQLDALRSMAAQLATDLSQRNFNRQVQ